MSAPSILDVESKKEKFPIESEIKLQIERELGPLNIDNAISLVRLARKMCKSVDDIASYQIARDVAVSAIRTHCAAANKLNRVDSMTDDETLFNVLDSLVLLPECASSFSHEGVGVYLCENGVVSEQSAWYLPILSDHLDRGSRFPKGWTSRRCFVIKDGARIAVTDKEFRKIRFDEFKGIHVCGDIEFRSGQVLIDFETD